MGVTICMSLIEYLEDKIINNLETPEEYALYCDLKWYGKIAFTYKEHKSTYFNLINEMKHMKNETY
jgi:hypothetical protein